MTNDKWSTLQAQFNASVEAKWSLDSTLTAKYGSGVCWWVYCNRGETKRRDAIKARQDRVIDRMFALIDAANPTNGLRSGTPLHTICSRMTWDEVLAS